MEQQVAKAARQATVDSWWVTAADFYAEARRRFPEVGVAHVDRAKAYVGGTERKSVRHKRPKVKRRAA